MQKTTVGFDYSTKGVWACTMIDGQPKMMTIFERRKKEPFVQFLDRLYPRFARTQDDCFEHVWGDHDPDSLVERRVWSGVEDYSHLFDREGAMGAVHWTLRSRLYHPEDGDDHVMVVPAKQWRNAIGLSGNANKDEVKQRVQALFPELPKNLAQDFYDAAAIARAVYKTVYMDPLSAS